MPRKTNLGITKLFALMHKSLTSLGIIVGSWMTCCQHRLTLVSSITICLKGLWYQSVPQFTMYDGSSNLSYHLMHFRKMMTLDIGTANTQCLKMMFEQPLKKSSSQTRRRKILAKKETLNHLITSLGKVARDFPIKGNRDESRSGLSH